MPYKQCEVCKKKFYSRPQNELSDTRGKYCSRECYLKDKQSKWIVLKCANCGKDIRRPLWRIRTKPMQHYFCSIKCYGEYKSKHFKEYSLANREYKDKVALELTEEILKKEYESGLRIKDIAKKYNCSYGLVNSRMRKYKIETNRARYTKGSCEDYWRRCFQRKYKGCQNCGWNKDICDVAHIKSRKNGGEYKESNLLYLCPNCHRLYDKGKLKI